ncbi:AIPR family protein [Anabaena cylindrica FACHB-243]|uniref:Abortive phage infection protein n=1 Tax=Anabaena cylindrica (strain ATCC 27899 / PCC 7122) TaxID=272123 RepID=K9ZLI4_ANACC|nr:MULTISPECIES: AIPR family protein [Anabaena]AFZ59397.1 Abortive phage infection protein [Anabaena cylindrica PCC 7122]MBD2417554.1 AIPR family protein [Anabaena cylindrica FACHB-243]MBY5280222.1 AIPR family protein [Anabaena sp. CCAP 1446/1C]MBY5308494.1 AIPR family protein [Anabaena sp. CCAP 1446/1C]MCM2405315.1 AIPR family protein [Anabaena sp. CCAP 1446/1C]
MLTKEFYNVIDSEINTLLEKYKDDEFIKKHKSAINNQKSYALLIWFLEFYGRKSNYKDFITDGDKDSSCDIVFDNTNNQGDKIFYVVQSKWNNADNSEKETDKDEILKALNDFDTILRGEKQNINEKIKAKLEDLDNHLKANGEVKFIFLTLSQYKGGADENISAFKKNDEKTKFEVIDINRIKVDYIDRTYKKIEPLNPLESYQNPEENPVTLEIVQKNGVVKIEKPFEAYMFLLRPKSIYDLFEKYGFALFYKNVRNPLLQSQFNEDIEITAVDNPAYFWYYNNGITAITYFLPTIGKKAEQIELTGLQIINGAQTVYAIYRAYKDATVTKRKQMDSESLVTLRLLKSGGKDFDLNVTRYTNSQNPVDDRDFCANDDIQIMLQNASYQTNVWYEKRRDEFRETPENVTEVPNYIFANTYLAYHLQDPSSVLKNDRQRNETGKDLNFISHIENKDGLYEKIFNNETTFENMLCGSYVWDVLCQNTSLLKKDNFNVGLYHLLALFKVGFTKYLKAKFNDKINVNKYIIKIYEQDDKEIIIKTVKFINQFVKRQIEVSDNEEKTTERIFKFLFEPYHYEKTKEALEDLEISVEDIENITIKDNEKLIEGEIGEENNSENND